MLSKHIRYWLAALIVLIAAAPISAGQPSYAQANSRAFPETGKTVRDKFLAYWDTHGGLAQQGYPISDEMREVSDTDGKSYTVQYFERAVFELHPENQPPNDVLLSLLGNFLYKQKYPGGAQAQRANPNNPRQFTETGKSVGGKFRAYWESHGGLAQQGYPISEEFQEKNDLDSKTYTVQYFERAVFEMHTENQPPYDVLLSQLGRFRYSQKYPGGPQPVGTAAPSETGVNIVDFYFSPNTITVAAGTKVTWTNVGPTIHTVEDKALKVFSSEILEKGQKFSYTFTKAGAYDYLCTLHPDMVAKVIVR